MLHEGIPFADIAIIVALPEELEAVLRHLPGAQRRHVEYSNRTYYESYVQTDDGDQSRVVVLQLPRMGNMEAAIATGELLRAWQPRAVIVAGIAGGTRPKEQRFGDLVVANQIVYYEEQKLTKAGREFRTRMFEPSSLLFDRAQHLDGVTSAHRPARAPQIFFAPIASGEKVVADAEWIKLLRTIAPKLAAVEMESAGVAAAALANARNTPFLAVKGISDFANAKKDDKSHQVAADNAAEWTIRFIRSAPIGHAPIRAIRTPTPVVAIDRVELFNQIRKRLNSEQFKTLCFVLNVDVDDLPGETKSDRVRELILEFERRGDYEKLVELWEKALADDTSSEFMSA